MSRRASPPTIQATSASPVGDARINDPGLVSAAFDDSWLTLEQEVALIDRLFRNALDFMRYRERLCRKKIRIISVTQNFGDDPASDLAVSMLAIFDEYHFAENAKHVRRTMMTSTGKSGQYRYYACAARIKRGPDACTGRRAPMEQLDDLVVGAVARHLVQPEQLTTLLQTWLDRSETAVAKRAAELKRLRARLTKLDGESARVIELVGNETLSPNDPQVASELGNIGAQKASTQADIAVLERQLDAGDRRITPAIIARFGDLLRRKLDESDGRTRKEYIQLLVDRVEVGDREVRITGRNAMLERAIMASQTPGAPVPKAERKWRARLDSNQRPQA